MNPEITIQEGIENDIGNLLGKSASVETASAFMAAYFQMKMHQGVVDLYDYTITDRKDLGFWARIEYSFAWNIGETKTANIGPNDTIKEAYKRAMAIV